MKKLVKTEKVKVKSFAIFGKKFLGLFVLSLVVFISVFSFSFAVSKANAATGINREINFQGKLVDNNGLNVADNTYTVVFSLYSVSSGGSAIWTETDSVTTKAGIFQVQLGATNSLPDNVTFNSDSLYLGIKVGSDLEMTPRIRFTAVPYAINSSALDGVVATQSATGFNLQGGTSAQSTVSFANNGSALTFQPGVTEGLTIDTNGANTLSLGSSANAINFGGSNNPSYLFNGTGGLTLDGTSLTMGNGSNATIQTTGSNSGLTLLSQGSGNITFGQNVGNGNVLITPNGGGQAGLIVNDWGSGDLFTASAAGTTKFTVGNNGVLTLSGGEYIDDNTAADTLILGSNAANGAGVIRIPVKSTTGDPAIAGGGDMYYNTFDGRFRCYQGSGWQNCITSANFQSTQASNTITLTASEQSILSGSITPSSTTGQIWINATATIVGDANSAHTVTIRIRRGSCTTGTQVGVDQTVSTANTGNGYTAAVNYVDTPGSTAAQTYNVCALTSAGSPTVTGRGMTMYEPTGAAAANGLGSLTVQSSDTSSSVTGVSTLQFGPSSTSSDQFIITNQTGGVARVTIGNQVGMLNQAETATGSWNFSNGLAVGNANPIGMLDVLGNSATSPVASLSGTTSAAGLVVNNNGTGDIFTASSSGVSHFTIQNNGTIKDSNYTTNGGLLYSDSNGVFTQLADNATGSCLNSAGIGAVPVWGTCDKFLNLWQANGPVLSPGNLTQDITFGGTATASAKFALLNMVGTNIPTASVSAQNANNSALVLAGNGSIQSVGRQTLTMGGSTTGDITFWPGGTANALYLASNGNIGIGTVNPAKKLDVNGTFNAGTATVTSLNGLSLTANATGFSVAGGTTSKTLQVNNTLTLAGTDGKTLTTNANITLAGTDGNTLTLNGNATIDQSLAQASTPTFANLIDSGLTALSAVYTDVSKQLTTTAPATGVIGFLQRGGGALSPTNITDDILLGATSTASAKFAFTNVAVNTPTASIAANTTNNATYLTGAGVLGTTNAQTLQIGSGSTGNVSLITVGTTALTAIAGGNIGIGTTAPTQKLDINGNARIEALTNSNGVLYADNTGLVKQTTTGGAGTLCLTSTNGGTPVFGSCSGSASTVWSQLSAPSTNLSLNMSANTTTFNWATGTSTNNLFSLTTDASANGTGALLNLATGIGSSVAPLSIAAGSKQALYVTSSGTIGVGTNAPVAALDVRASSATTPAASFSATSTFAGLVVNNSGTGDIFTASSGGVPHFTIQNNGSIVDSNYTQGGGLLYANSSGVFNQLADTATGNCLTSAGAGSVPTWTNCSNLGTNYWSQTSTGLTYLGNTTADFAIGGTSTISAKFAFINVNNGTPIASISAQSGTKSALVLGANSTVQSVNAQTLTFGGTSTGDIQFLPGNNASGMYMTSGGKVGIGNNAPTYTLDVTGNIRATTGFNGTCLAAGATFKTTTSSSCNMDVAEIYPSTQDVASGDVVMIDPTATNAAVKKADQPYGQSVMGIVTTHPGIILGIDGSSVMMGGETTTYMQNADPRMPAVALNGKVPVKVSSMNGAIEPGDMLTTSSIPGVAMKATEPGQIIGKALESYNGDPSTVGTVLIFVNISWYDPQVNMSAGGNYDLLQNTDLSLFDQANNTASTSGVLNTYYTIQDGAGIAVTSSTAFAKATIANIQAGAIIAKQISTNQLNVTTGNITLGGETLDDYITAKIKQILSQRDQTVSTFAAVNGLITATQSAQLVQSMLSQHDLSATVSGMTVSGVLGANTITTQHIAGLVDLSASTITTATLSAQTITADTIKANHIEGLDIITTGLKKDDARIAALENMVASQSAAVAPTGIIATPSVGLAVINDSTVSTTPSGDLRVKGNALVEGILHVVDTLFANNFIANGVSDFFGNVVFHTGVQFENTPTFNNDTAGIAVVKKATDHVDVKFNKAYDQIPVVNVSITEVSLTPTPSETPDQMKQRQQEIEKTLLADSIHFIITNKTADGFTILLDKPADEDIAFSWLALSVSNPVIFQSDQQHPSPTDALSPSPIDTIIPKDATTSAGF